ncbi:MAG: hypothetical protein Q8L99_14050 [Polycyclovorans sp.]|jgi:hypothetical protein|nr:hypothetical protein [Gammaproteobacteria bacterium]MDP1544263.1 hypothetical protein [Polycyclovorans sp.]MEC8847781.1 hypothetical protein [Pseudomonadota bacterium]
MRSISGSRFGVHAVDIQHFLDRQSEEGRTGAIGWFSKATASPDPQRCWAARTR